MGIAPTANKSDITAAEGALIVAAAATWKGTPYSLVGSGSVLAKGGDCSGSTWRIYTAANLPYEYQATATFVDYAKKTGRFRELAAGEARQDGDVLYWSGHMAIYSTFTTTGDSAYSVTDRVNKAGHPWKQKNDMWTASHPGGPTYAAGSIQYWGKGEPRVFRYVKK